MKVLFDLTFAGYPVSGIPNEVALLFEMFSRESSEIEVDALIHQAMSPRVQRLSKAHSISNIATILARYNNVREDQATTLRFLFEMSLYLLEFRFQYAWGMFKRHYLELGDADKEIIFEAIYRTFFERTAKQESKPYLMDRSYLFTRHHYEFSLLKSTFGAGPERFKVPSKYDVTINYGLKNILFTGRAKKIHRHVDLIAFEAPDTLGGIAVIRQTLHNLRRVLVKSDLVICLTEAARHKLISVEPKLRNRTGIIPAIIPQLAKRDSSGEYLSNVFVTHNWSLEKLSARERRAVERKIFSEFMGGKDIPEYLVTVSTIEPRKNFIAIIRAWEYVRFYLGRKVKLVTIGGLGWNTEKIEPLFLRYARQGEIIPLRDVPKFAFEVILSNASLFVFLSHTEGFGVGPLEGLQCGCRALVLDSPIYREIYKDAVDYVNGTEGARVGEAIAELLDQRKNNPNEFYSALDRSKDVLNLYTADSVRRMWIDAIREVAGK